MTCCAHCVYTLVLIDTRKSSLFNIAINLGSHVLQGMRLCCHWQNSVCLGDKLCLCRSVVGLSIDFQILNLLGFFCYATYNVALFGIPAVQEQYQAAFGKNIPVGLEDVLFSVHAFAITALTLIQCVVYERGEQRFDTLNGWISVAVSAVAVIMFGLVTISQSQDHRIPQLTWINLLLALSAVKLVISLIKYIPQVRTVD